MTKTITVQFHVEPDDLKEVMETVFDSKGHNTEQDLVKIIQWALYDNYAGPMLAGQFNIQPNRR